MRGLEEIAQLENAYHKTWQPKSTYPLSKEKIGKTTSMYSQIQEDFSHILACLSILSFESQVPASDLFSGSKFDSP